MMSLFWYYRPEHTEHDAKSSESPYELYASKHKDVNSVACIEDKCYVLTFNEYCRFVSYSYTRTYIHIPIGLYVLNYIRVLTRNCFAIVLVGAYISVTYVRVSQK